MRHLHLHAHTKRGRLRTLRKFLVVGVAIAVTVGCSASKQNPGDDVPGAASETSLIVNEELYAQLPTSIREHDELRVGIEASYPPMESFADDGRTIIGVDPDIAEALATRLGITVTFVNDDFAALPDLLEKGKIDIIMSAMTDTQERERDLDFVNYFKAGTSIVVQRGNPQVISELSSLCGHSVGIEAGTTQAHLLDRQQFRCDRPINTIETDTNDDALILLRTGRVDAVLMDYPPAELLTTAPETHSDYEMATTAQYEPGLYGIAISKSQTKLRDVIYEALSDLHSTGAYESILFRWGVGDGAIANISINAAGGS